MMTPSQLKEYEFKTAGRNAYKADDVDDFFAEVAAHYTKMFHENGELVRRVGLLADRLEKFKKEEEEIKSAVVSAQRAADIIVRDAKNSVADAQSEAEAVLAAAKSEAELIKSDAEKQAVADAELLLSMTRDKALEIVKEAKEEAQEILLSANATAKEQMGAATRTMTSESILYDMLKKEVAEFKTSILNQYKTHIELISKLPELAEEEARKQEENTEAEKAEALSEAAAFEAATAEAEEKAEESEKAEDLQDASQGEDVFSFSDDYTEADADEEAVSDDLAPVNIYEDEEYPQNIFEESASEVEHTSEDNSLSADDFSEDSLYNYVDEKEALEANERKEALRYFTNENKADVMEVDEDMLTQDGELVVKTDLPLSVFDNVENLEFVDDFNGMEKEEEQSAFSFSDVQVNKSVKKRMYNKVTVDPAYLDFLAAENDAEREEGLPNLSFEEDIDIASNTPSNEDSDGEASQRRSFFKRK